MDGAPNCPINGIMAAADNHSIPATSPFCQPQRRHLASSIKLSVLSYRYGSPYGSPYSTQYNSRLPGCRQAAVAYVADETMDDDDLVVSVASLKPSLFVHACDNRAKKKGAPAFTSRDTVIRDEQR